MCSTNKCSHDKSWLDEVVSPEFCGFAMGWSVIQTGYQVIHTHDLKIALQEMANYFLSDHSDWMKVLGMLLT